MNGWRRLWRHNRLDAELARELRFHEDEAVADLVARGLDPSEARRQARLAMGGPEQVKEECRDVRGTRWFADLVHDGRYALRTLRRMPGFTAVAVVVLGLGIGATSVMFTVINRVLLRPLAYPAADRLVSLRGASDALGEFWGFSNPDFQDLRRDSRSVALAAWTYGGGTISSPGEAAYVNGREVSADLFAVLDVAVRHGRSFARAEDQLGAAPVAILSTGEAQRRYGSAARAVGQSLVFDGQSYTVVGVAQEGFALSGDADVITPLGQNRTSRMGNRHARFIRVLGRLQPGVTLERARAELSVVARRLAAEYPASNAGIAVRPRPLLQETVGDIGSTLWLLLAAVGLVLLIACANIGSLLLARATAREREFAMRVALGASLGRLIRQCLTESLVLGGAGAIVAALLATLGLRPFVAWWPGALPRAEEIQVDGSTWFFTVAIAVASSLLFGLAPALRVPARRVEQSLRANARTVAGSSRRLQSAFVMVEVALAVVLLVAAGMFGRTLLKLSSLNPGVNVHNVLTARFAMSPTSLTTPAQMRAAWQDVLERAAAVPGVEAAALADVIPMREGQNSLTYSTAAAVPPPNEAPSALATAATPDFLRVLGIPLRHGRFFDDRDRMDSEPVLVIDETLAQHAFGTDDAVGKRLWVPAMGPAALRIVGVVGHVRHWGLAADDRSRVRDQMYYPFAQVPGSLLRLFSTFMSVTVRTQVPPLNVEAALRQTLRGASADQALYDVRTLAQLVAASLERQRFLMWLFGVFAGAALLLACIGIYGVLAYITNQRVPELGVRMALGATPREVVGLVLRQSVSMVAVGVGCGALASWAAGRLLVQFVEGMRPIDLSTVAAVIVVLVAAALLASAVPARRAGRLSVTEALRE